MHCLSLESTSKEIDRSSYIRTMRHYARPYIAHTSRKEWRGGYPFFAEYNFSVEYKPGRLNVVADALSRRPDFEPAAQSNSGNDPTVSTLSTSVLSSTLIDNIKNAYTEDKDLLCLVDLLMNPSSNFLKIYRMDSSDDPLNTEDLCLLCRLSL